MSEKLKWAVVWRGERYEVDDLDPEDVATIASALVAVVVARATGRDPGEMFQELVLATTEELLVAIGVEVPAVEPA